MKPIHLFDILIIFALIDVKIEGYESSGYEIHEHPSFFQTPYTDRESQVFAEPATLISTVPGEHASLLQQVPSRSASLEDSFNSKRFGISFSASISPSWPVSAQPATRANPFHQSSNVYSSPSFASTYPAKSIGDCSQCWCQCKSLSYRGSFGSIEGNCNSYFNGRKWCFVENNIGSGYSTCPDIKTSQKFIDESWSYIACNTPAQSQSQCLHCL